MIAFEKLLDDVRNNKTAEDVKIDYFVYYGNLTKKHLVPFAKALAENTSIKSLFIHNAMDTDVCEAFGEALKRNTSLTSLHFFATQIGCWQVKYIADALVHNKTLTTLNFDVGNTFAYDGVEAIANALIHNQTLTTLSFITNNFFINKATVLSYALAKNRVLRTLNLDLNGGTISDISGQKLVQGLSENLTLTTLNLKRYQLSQDDISKFKAALSNPYVLKCIYNIDIEGATEKMNDIKPARLRQINALLKRNSTYRKVCERMSLLMGFHSRLGAGSALHAMSKDPLFDKKNMLSLIFQFSGFGKDSFVVGADETITQDCEEQKTQNDKPGGKGDTKRIAEQSMQPRLEKKLVAEQETSQQTKVVERENLQNLSAPRAGAGAGAGAQIISDSNSTAEEPKVPRPTKR